MFELAVLILLCCAVGWGLWRMGSMWRPSRPGRGRPPGFMAGRREEKK